MARKHNNKPETACDWRGCITLCQILAIDDTPGEFLKDKELRVLANSWGITDPHGRIIDHLPMGDLIELLAQHAVEHAHSGTCAYFEIPEMQQCEYCLAMADCELHT